MQAAMELLRANNLSLSFGDKPLLDGVDFGINQGERVCLVGRNGEGKSTLMKLLAGQLEPDSGTIFRPFETRIAYLPQAVPEGVSGTNYDVVMAGVEDAADLLAEFDALSVEMADDLSDSDREKKMARMQSVQEEIDSLGAWDLSHRVIAQLSRLNLAPDSRFEDMSGGMKRQVLLIRSLVTNPSVLVLDEPTNHLDTEAIDWLEKFILDFDGGVLFVTHDRMLLRRIATRIIDLDRGKLTSWPGDFERYQKMKHEALESESKSWSEFDKNLAKEEAWIRQGIKARRTRNEGRVRALKKLREERKERRNRVGTAKIVIHEADSTGMRVLEADKIGFQWGDQKIVEQFSIHIQRRDRVGFIGPNGCGKTTLIRLLLGELEPQSGRVYFGTNLKIVYFDQLREQLDPNKTVQQNLSDGHDTVIVNGRARHIISYLQDFLFAPHRARSLVGVLSGGERNRLLLAKMFIQEANVLVMDEPTNDLDAETLELLESVLLDFNGTLLLVSHDREFLNNVVTSSIAYDYDGVFRTYAGGYSDWQLQRPKPPVEEAPAPKEELNEPKPSAPEKKKKPTYMEQKEFEQLPGLLEALEAEQEEVRKKLEDPDFYQNSPDEFMATSSRSEAIEEELLRLYERWEYLDALH